MLRLAVLLVLCGAADVHAARFSIQDYGATANDQSDDTVAVLKTLKACEAAGGGEVFVPAGTYVVSRQGAESPILEVPSNTTLLLEVLYNSIHSYLHHCFASTPSTGVPIHAISLITT